MSMYKRPPLRVRDIRPPKKCDSANLKPGSFLHTLLNPPPTQFYKPVKQPIYRKDDYLALLKKNYKELGLEYKEPDIPDYIPPPPKETKKEPYIDFPDKVFIRMKILKSGIIRIKLDTSLSVIYEKYYSKFKQPPAKSVIQVYKSMGFSDDFLTKLKNNFEKNVGYHKIIGKIIERVFEKEPAKKTKKKKEEEPKPKPEPEEEEEEQEQDQEDDGPEEDEGMDVEADEDPDEQPQEEEYFSDGDD